MSVFVFPMLIVRRVANFADVKLRQKYENKSLNQRDEHAQGH